MLRKKFEKLKVRFGKHVRFKLFIIEILKYLVYVLLWDFVCLKSSFQRIFIAMLKWTTVVVSSSRLIGCYDFKTTIRCIICALAFFSIAMTEVVCVLFLELVHFHYFGKLAAPKYKCFLQRETSTLKLMNPLI